ncbi:MAG: hypothetical protein ACHQAQ_19435, partial [Hyphomicrobiales bacterium]
MTKMNLAGHAAPADRAEPVADLMCRVADELQDIARSIDQVSVPVDDALTRGTGSRHPPLILAMQELDHTRQKLACLASFLTRLAHSMP